MKKMLLCLLLACQLLTASACETGYWPEREYTHVAPVGEVPAEFVERLEAARLSDACPVGENFVSTHTNHIVWLDKHGATLADCSFAYDPTLHVWEESVTATSDGGLLFTRNFSDRYQSETERWASEDGVASQVIKLDAAGNVQWLSELEGVEGLMLAQCIETSDGYCFFGARETPETKRLGVGSPTDLTVLLLDKQGQVVSLTTFGGSDFDMFYRAEKVDGGYVIYALVQSNDGIFENTLEEGTVNASWKLTVNEQFELVAMEKVTYEALYGAEVLGYVAGQPVCEDDPRVLVNGAGTPLRVIDYGDMYLIISRNITGVDERVSLAINMVYYRYETVYSAWQDGELLWRAVTDNHSDYDDLQLYWAPVSDD